MDKKLREATNLCVEGYKFAFAVWSKQETGCLTSVFF